MFFALNNLLSRQLASVMRQWFPHLSSSFILPTYIDHTYVVMLNTINIQKYVSFHLFLKYQIWSEKGTISLCMQKYSSVE